MREIVCCPKCKSAARPNYKRFKCRACYHCFPLQDAFIRKRLPSRQAAVRQDKPQRYKGQPAGRITIGRGAFWGAGIV